MGRQIDAETTPSLLVRIRDHQDVSAWDTFAEVYSPLVYNFCRLRGLQAQDAADVTQEVLLRVARAIRNFEYDPVQGLFRDWLARIVNNEVLRHFSAASKTTALPPDFDVEGQVELWNEHFQQQILAAALVRCQKRFTAETWTLFDRSWLQKLAADEVAKQSAVSIEKVYIARSRVLKQLRHEVAILAEDAG